uniref:Peptidase S1 domain-containing protein n=1 Tax=Callorhinchus milii TaxID=7868 RepID=A0A4W3I6S1_CALMI
MQELLLLIDLDTEVVNLFGWPTEYIFLLVTHRIVGGLSTTDGEWPFQVSLQHHGQHFCGATLVSCRWIVSAAHCFENRNEDSLTAVFGVHYLNKEMNPNVQIRTIRKIIIHPDANFSTTDYDVALLELTTPIHYTDFVQPACLPPATPLFTDGQYCIIIGWGKISENGMYFFINPEHLSPNDCEALTSQTITRQMMCAGVLEGGKDTCQGDSGGPLLCQDVDSRAWILAGIVSGGIGCARPNLPGIYAKTTAFSNWITEIING